MGVERQLEMIRQRVVGVIDQVVHHDDKAWLLGQIALPPNDIVDLVEELHESSTASCADIFRAHIVGRSGNGLVHRLEVLVEGEFFTNIGKYLKSHLREVAFALRAVRLQHLEDFKCIGQGQPVLEVDRKLVQRGIHR